MIEDTDDQMIVRMPRFMGMAGTGGGPFLGAHILRKDPLQTFEKV